MILWRDSMSVQNDLIDSEHRFLICLINSVELALHSDERSEALGLLVEELADYADYHFRHEERIQLGIFFPEVVEHRAAHRKLVARFTELRTRLLALSTSDTDDRATTEIVQLLRDWLMNHVLKEDMRMKPYFSALPSNFSP